MRYELALTFTCYKTTGNEISINFTLLVFSRQ